jgi:hypothetical protein
VEGATIAISVSAGIRVQTTVGGKFKGKTKEFEVDTFDITGPHDAARHLQQILEKYRRLPPTQPRQRRFQGRL